MSVAVALALVIQMFVAPTAVASSCSSSDFAAGSGNGLSAGAAFEISTREHLSALSGCLGTSFSGYFFELVSNIDLTGEANPWAPLGTSGSPFEGTFNGGNFRIYNLHASGVRAGLFS